MSDISTIPKAKGIPETKITEELVLHSRGFFSMPMLSGLGRSGALEVILSKSQFSVEDIPTIPNTKLLRHSFQYLARIGMLERANAEETLYRKTELGKQVFRRVNSFYAPHSYRAYMQNYYEQLMNAGPYEKQEVDRLENIIGSGKTHERYFPPAVSYLRRKLKFDIIADIGCGDGRFLDFVLQGIPNIKAVGIDLSEVSVESTGKNLRKKYPDREITMICSDASDVKKWSEPVSKFSKSGKLVISMWFLLHEISQRDPKNVIQFLGQVHQLFPKTPLIICELVRQEAELLTKYRKEMMMAEYLLFHDLSDQGVLSWKEYQNILEQIPYKVVMERVFDELGDEGDAKEPSTFVWALIPN